MNESQGQEKLKNMVAAIAVDSAIDGYIAGLSPHEQSMCFLLGYAVGQLRQLGWKGETIENRIRLENVGLDAMLRHVEQSDENDNLSEIAGRGLEAAQRAIRESVQAGSCGPVIPPR